jgi:predicted nuclease with TOPRIM domain
MATDPLDIIQALQAIESRLDSRFDKIDEKFARIDEKFDRVERKFDQVDVRFGELETGLAGIKAAQATQAGILVGQAASLVQHMHRTELLEGALAEVDDRITPLQKKVQVAAISVRVAAGFAAVGSMLMAGPKALDYLKVLLTIVGL